MHEYLITKNILKTVIDEAEKAGAKRVLEIYLTIGELSSFEKGSIEMYFDILSENTIANGAKIITRKKPVEFHCRKCDLDYLIDHVSYSCPICGETGKYNGSGKEFLIESIEID